jgi:3-deoxy-manno-octulosonate cytidylyltransferase (CMP-KDO synthetase)
MNCVGIIPARYQSSRFPGKPLAEILGKPMIWWVYQKARRCTKLDDVYVATDNDKIYNYCKTQNINVIKTGDNPTGTDRIAEANETIQADYVVNIQGDEPTIHPETISKAIDTSFPVTNLMAKASTDDLSSDIPKVVTDKNGALIYMSRYAIPKIKGHSCLHMKQVCVYGFTAEILQTFHSLPRERNEQAEDIEILRFIEHGIPVKMIEVKQHGSAVDHPKDIKIVEHELRAKYDAIIFDFDGVLVDSESIKRESLQKLYPPEIRQHITLEEGGKSRYEKISFYHKKYLKQSLTPEEVNTLAEQYKSLVFQPIIDAPLIKETNALLELNDIEFYMVSGTPTNELNEILSKKGLIDKFKKIYGGEFEKNETIRAIASSINTDKVLYIGDQKSDETASKQAGVSFFGYGPTYNNPDIQEVWI